MFESRSRVETGFGLLVLGEIRRRRSALAGPERREQQVLVREDDSGAERTVTIADADVDLIAASLRRSPGTVRRQVAQARMLCTRLPRTHAELMSGRISEEHAEVIVRTAVDLPGAALPAYERGVLPKAAVLTPGQAGSLARRVRARVDRAGEEARRAAARRHEGVRVWAEGDGLACLLARLPIADAARVHAALDERARRADAPCDATLGQRRVRGLVEALCGKDGEPSSVGVEVQVAVDLATLAGLADGSAMVALGHGAPEPITATALRELLGDPSVPVTLRRLVTEPLTGALLDRGRTAYRVPDSLRAYLVARDGTCRFPGCTRAAITCEIDHAIPWRERGPTDRCNLGPLCRRHHVLKTHAQWRISEVRADGTTVWIGPDGRDYVFHPFPVVDPPDPVPPPDAGQRDGPPFPF